MFYMSQSYSIQSKNDGPTYEKEIMWYKIAHSSNIQTI